MHKLPEQEQLERAVNNYRRGLILAEKTRFASRVREAWVQRYRIAMQLEQARVAKLKELRQEKGNERANDCGG